MHSLPAQSLIPEQAAAAPEVNWIRFVPPLKGTMDLLTNVVELNFCKYDHLPNNLRSRTEARPADDEPSYRRDENLRSGGALGVGQRPHSKKLPVHRTAHGCFSGHQYRGQSQVCPDHAWAQVRGHDPRHLRGPLRSGCRGGTFGRGASRSVGGMWARDAERPPG